MEREALFTVMAAGSFLVAVWGLAAGMRCRLSKVSLRSEPSAYWLLLAPLLAGLVAVAFLLGWLLQEPDPADEFAAPLLWACALVALLIVARAVRRAWLSARAAQTFDLPVATFGLLRCHTHLSAAFQRRARPAVLAAALTHEAAHARARDPLRIWLAQFACDLQWPMRSAPARLHAWLLSLELRRDAEARAAGVRGEDLAEAVLLAARLVQRQRRAPHTPVAELAPAELGVALRVRRLLAEPEPAATSRRWIHAAAFVALLVMAIGLGIEFGESLLSSIPGIWR